MISSQKLNLGHSFTEATVVLIDSASVSLDAALGNTFYLNAEGDRTLEAPLNPVDGQKIVIRHLAASAARTLSLSSSAGGFRFGSDITSITQTASGTSDYIGCIYNGSVNFWDVVAYAKGF